MSDLDLQLSIVRDCMSAQSAEVQVEYKMDAIIRELDEFCGMASNPETIDLIERNKIAVGQMLTRVQLIASFLMARHTTTGFRLVSKN